MAYNERAHKILYRPEIDGLRAGVAYEKNGCRPLFHLNTSGLTVCANMNSEIFIFVREHKVKNVILIARSAMLRADKLLSYALPSAENTAAHEQFLNIIKPFVTEITLLDPTSFLCNTNVCQIGITEVSYYTDTNHLSIMGSKRLEPLLEKIFSEIAAAQ